MLTRKNGFIKKSSFLRIKYRLKVFYSTFFLRILLFFPKTHPIMKFRQSLFPAIFFALFCLFCHVAIAQNGGQRLQIMQGDVLVGTTDVNGGAINISASFPLSFKSLDAPTPTIPNAPCDGQLNQSCGWYKGFWLFGDGNYLKFSDDVAGMDANSLNIRSYDYGRNGAFKPVVYLTEKYNNDNPPEAARATLNINQATVSGTIPEPTKRLANSPEKRIDIDYNHAPRVKYPINFVLSYRSNEDATNVLFFYNGLKNGNDISAIAPASILQYQASEATAYHTTAFGPLSSDLQLGTGAFPPISAGSILDPLNSRYKSLLNYEVRSPISAFTQGLTELRVFPVFLTNNSNALPGGEIPNNPTSFVAIILGTKPINDSDPNFNKLSTLARQLLGQNVPSDLRLNPNSSLFIRDIQYQEMQILRSHDPNSLTVTDIRDLGNGQYRVFFRMVVCNEGESPETNISLRFNDLTGGKYSVRPSEISGVGLDGIAQVWTGGTAGNPWKVGLPGYQISGVPATYSPACNELFFSIDTDLDGVQKLYQNSPRALEACVDFSAGAGECSENEPLRVNAFQTDGKYRAADPDPVPDECPWIIWALLILVLIGVIWYWYSRQAE